VVSGDTDHGEKMKNKLRKIVIFYNSNRLILLEAPRHPGTL
jgi:hypothetical protein